VAEQCLSCARTPRVGWAAALQGASRATCCGVLPAAISRSARCHASSSVTAVAAGGARGSAPSSCDGKPLQKNVHSAATSDNTPQDVSGRVAKSALFLPIPILQTKRGQLFPIGRVAKSALFLPIPILQTKRGQLFPIGRVAKSASRRFSVSPRGTVAAAARSAESNPGPQSVCPDSLQHLRNAVWLQACSGWRGVWPRALAPAAPSLPPPQRRSQARCSTASGGAAACLTCWRCPLWRRRPPAACDPSPHTASAPTRHARARDTGEGKPAGKDSPMPPVDR
jgi:hypothetical protein